ncbi:AlpA family transcriptional regulator [Mycobacterium sp. 1165196.3]|uniref:helix-turn-helix transcriptional regulator n=1 Tax=Mycobacterium sp. 1165196.3 TaxID=1834071 RepID=UPI0009EF6880|nr:helix-turn-helix domain-containing protein [Mycobacterium sp. 1165196.3]
MERLTTAEAAKYLKLPEATLRWWRHAGAGPKSYRLGGRRVFYDLTDLKQWETDQKATSSVGGVG